MRRRTRQLGAITGERLEYRLPASVFLALTKAKSQAVCFGNAEGLLKFALHKARFQEQSAKWSAERAERVQLRPGFEDRQAYLDDVKKRLKKGASMKAKKADNLTDFTEQLTLEIRRLRENNVRGNIPVCLYRATGKVAKFPREVRRTEAIHERFHADVRRAEARLGASLDDRECGQAAKEMFKRDLGDIGQSAYAASVIAQWGTPLEELLARTEEIRKSCLKSEKQCTETKERFRSTMSRSGGPYSDKIIEMAEKAVREKYGSAMGFVTQALRACKVRR